MDLTDSPAEQQFRAGVVKFLAAELPAGWAGYGALSPAEQAPFAARWRERLIEQRLLGVAWPREYGGGGLSLVEQAILTEEFVRAGVPYLPHPNDSFGLNLLGPTLLRMGTEDQRKRFLPPTLSGEIRWAQGYSEPDAGSDLFALRTSGELSGDTIVLNGQKIWQSAGLTATWLFTLVRTERDSSGGRGLSFVLVPLDQPGVEVRGIRTITGLPEFCEVFFTDARASVHDVVGGVGAGAKVALTLLGFERGAGGLASALSLRLELDRLIELVRAKNRNTDPAVRAGIVRCWSRVHQLRCLAMRVLSESAHGAAPGPEASLIKLLTAEYTQAATSLAMEVLGADVLAPTGPRAVEWLRPQPLGLPATSTAAWVDDYLNARARTIYGGSSEIQRNTIAERILGLPAEPRPTRT